MKTIIDIPQPTFRQAKTLADSQGISIEKLVMQAIEEKVRRGGSGTRQTPRWMKLSGAFGKTRAARAETRRIQKTIDEEFERIEPEDRQ